MRDSIEEALRANDWDFVLERVRAHIDTMSAQQRAVLAERIFRDASDWLSERADCRRWLEEVHERPGAQDTLEPPELLFPGGNSAVAAAEAASDGALSCGTSLASAIAAIAMANLDEILWGDRIVEWKADYQRPIDTQQSESAYRIRAEWNSERMKEAQIQEWRMRLDRYLGPSWAG